MTQEQSNKLEWILYNNKLYKEVFKACEPASRVTKAANAFLQMKSKSSPSEDSVPVVNGDIIYLDNAYVADKILYEHNLQELKSWMLEKRYTIENKHISVKSTDVSSFKHVNNIQSQNIPSVPEVEQFDFTHSSYKKDESFSEIFRKRLRRLDSLIKNNSIVLEQTMTTPNLLGKSSKNLGSWKENRVRSTSRKENIMLLSKNNHLKYKFDEVYDFGFIGQELQLDGRYLGSFKNFPNIVHGSLFVENCCYLLSFDGFPKVIEKNAHLTNCVFKKDLQLPQFTINGDFIFNGVNEHNMLIALGLSDDIIINGSIISTLYYGTLEDLKKIVRTKMNYGRV